MSVRRATCARCGRPDRQVVKVMPDGPLCAACRAEAVRRRGRCDGCRTERLLPGVSPAGGRLCAPCAGIDDNYTCSRCGTEWALRRGICEWCHLAEVLDGLMHGPIDLSPLRAQLLGTPKPDSLIIWAYQDHVKALLRGLATGTVALSHDALDGFVARQAADHMRSLLVAAGLLAYRPRPLPPRVHRRTTCARCGRPDQLVAKVMPDGRLCKACHCEAVRHRGRCDGCGTERLLPGVSPAGGRLCCSCAGIDGNYTCSRCGTEWALRRGICEWCHLAEVLDGLMDGPIDLSPLRTKLLEAARPDRLIIWLYDAPPRKLIQALNTGAIPLSHQGLDSFVHRVAADHLRALLVAAGVLPARDERLAHFDRWVAERLAEVAATETDLKLLQQFATWGLRRHLVTQSRKGPLRDEQVTNATQSLRVAASLLAWLRERERDLATCTQADLDDWFTTPPATRAQATTFVRWAVATRRTAKLSVPKRRHAITAALDETKRVEALRGLLAPGTGRLEHRVAAMLLMLFGQPFNKIAALRVQDIHVEGEATGIRLGQGITPIPEPFAAMLRELLSCRPNLNTAANPTSPWLFPGRSAGSHLRPSTLRAKVMEIGIDILAARNAALRHLVLDCPPPVVADTLGYSYQTIDRHAIRAGSPWSSYAAIRAHPRPDPTPAPAKRATQTARQ